jgi:hypothetical protein
MQHPDLVLQHLNKNAYNIRMKYLKHLEHAAMQHPDILLQHHDETLETYF